MPPELETRQDLLDYGAGVRSRLNAWWQSAGQDTDFAQSGKVYYGDVTLHEVLERTAWHSGQHMRQLMLTLNQHFHCCPSKSSYDSEFWKREMVPAPL